MQGQLLLRLAAKCAVNQCSQPEQLDNNLAAWLDTYQLECILASFEPCTSSHKLLLQHVPKGWYLLCSAPHSKLSHAVTETTAFCDQYEHCVSKAYETLICKHAGFLLLLMTSVHTVSRQLSSVQELVISSNRNPACLRINVSYACDALRSFIHVQDANSCDLCNSKHIDRFCVRILVVADIAQVLAASHPVSSAAAAAASWKLIKGIC